MDREQLKGKQTPGKWIVIASWNDYVITVDGLGNDVIVWQDGAYDTPTMTEADATLAAEAGNVANRTGMWPEDMEARIKELEEVLERLLGEFGRQDHLTDYSAGTHARAILNKKP